MITNHKTISKILSVLWFLTQNIEAVDDDRKDEDPLDALRSALVKQGVGQAPQQASGNPPQIQQSANVEEEPCSRKPPIDNPRSYSSDIRTILELETANFKAGLPQNQPFSSLMKRASRSSSSSKLSSSWFTPMNSPEHDE